MDVWPRCLQRLEAELPLEDVRTWLKPLQADRRGDGLVLYAPNAFIVEQVRERYLARIQDLLGHFAGHRDVSLEIGSRARVVDPRASIATNGCRRPERSRGSGTSARKASRLPGSGGVIGVDSEGCGRQPTAN